MSARLIIFEGPDACGKTTLSKTTANEMGAVYWHMTCTSKLAPAMHDYQTNAVENIIDNLKAGRDVVIDRLWPSEFCYGSHFRGITMMDMEFIAQSVAELNPTYVFCMDEDGVHTAEERHRAHLDPAHPYAPADFKCIYGNYEKLIRKWDTESHGEMLVVPFCKNPDFERSHLAFIHNVLLK